MQARVSQALALAALIALGVVGLAPVVSGPAHAQTEVMKSPTIAVIDMQAIRRESKAVQSIERQIQQQKSEYQKQISEQEQQIREQDQSLAKQRSILSDEAFNEKRNQLRQQLSSVRRDIQKRRKELDQNYSEAMQRVQQQLIEIVQNVAEERDLDIILNKAAVVLVKPEVDLTEVALKRLNNQLTAVDVPDIQQ